MSNGIFKGDPDPDIDVLASLDPQSDADVQRYLGISEVEWSLLSAARIASRRATLAEDINYYVGGSRHVITDADRRVMAEKGCSAEVLAALSPRRRAAYRSKY